MNSPFELAILRSYAKRRGFVGRLSSPNSAWDATMFEDVHTHPPAELVIVERRVSERDSVPTVKVDKKRIDAVVEASFRHQIPAYLIVAWADINGYINLSEIEANREEGEALFPETELEGGKRVYCLDVLMFRVLAESPEAVIA